MELTKERGIELLKSHNRQELGQFIVQYATSKGKDPNKTQILIQYLLIKNLLKELVDNTVLHLLQKQGITITSVIDRRSGEILKIY